MPTQYRVIILSEAFRDLDRIIERATTVRILTIRHGARKPPRGFSDLST